MPASHPARPCYTHQAPLLKVFLRPGEAASENVGDSFCTNRWGELADTFKTLTISWFSTLNDSELKNVSSFI